MCGLHRLSRKLTSRRGFLSTIISATKLAPIIPTINPTTPAGAGVLGYRKIISKMMRLSGTPRSHKSTGILVCTFRGEKSEASSRFPTRFVPLLVAIHAAFQGCEAGGERSGEHRSRKPERELHGALPRLIRCRLGLCRHLGYASLCISLAEARAGRYHPRDVSAVGGRYIRSSAPTRSDNATKFGPGGRDVARRCPSGVSLGLFPVKNGIFAGFNPYWSGRKP